MIKQFMRIDRRHEKQTIAFCVTELTSENILFFLDSRIGLNSAR